MAARGRRAAASDASAIARSTLASGGVNAWPVGVQWPRIKVPRALEGYWAWVKPAVGRGGYRFRNLGKVETLRLVELCNY